MYGSIGKGRRRRARSVGGDLVNVVVLAVFAAFMALPMVYAVCSAFKPLDELFVFPPRFFVQNPTLDNFENLFVLMSQSWIPFSRYVLNTLLITAASTFGNVILAAMAAYMLEKRVFPGSETLFRLVVMTLMFSGTVTAIPNYIILSKLHLIDTYFSLILPAIASPLGLFLMKQFMGGVHNALLESARLDGAGELRIFWSIVMPLVRPAWLTLIILTFQTMWAQTGGIYLYSEQKKTLPYALGQVASGGIARAGVSSAIALLMMIVPITVFIVSQSKILQTMSSAGIKE